jgi:YbbR domain-containing protein
MNKKILTIISSILFSIILWGSVTLSNSYFTTIFVPVRLSNIPNGYGVGYKTLKETSLRIKGEGWKLISIALGNEEDFIVPAGNIDGDSKSVRLSNALGDNAWLSTGLQVFDISPDTMSYKLERIREKKVVIKPDVELNFKSEYGLVSPIKTIPESVVVYGPVSLLQKLQYVNTTNKIYSNLDEAVNEKVELKKLENINFNRYSCELKFDVQKIVDRKFDNLQVEVINVPKDQSIILMPSRISVVLRGGINLLGKLKAEEIRPYIDYGDIIKDTLGQIEPKLKIPFFSTIVDKSPEKFQYIIKKF